MNQPLLISVKQGQAAQPMSLKEALKLIQANAGQHPAAAEHLIHQLIAQRPAEPAPYQILLNIYSVGKRVDDAQAHAELMLQRFAGVAQIMLQVANYYQLAGDTDRAFQLLNKAIAANPEYAPAYSFKGDMLIVEGDFEAAKSALQKSIELDYRNPSALHQYARIVKAGLPQDYRDKVESLIRSQQFQGFNAVKLYFALAWSFAGENADLHFKYLKMGNDLVARAHPSPIQGMRQEFDKIERFVDASLVQSMPASGRREQPIFIASPPRSGSTLLEQILAAHSSTNAIGESNAFQQAVRKTGQMKHQDPRLYNWPKGQAFVECLTEIDLQFTQSAFVKQAKGKRIVDKSIDNYRIIGPLLMTYPHARVIHLQRDPMDVVFSCYQQLFETGFNLLFDLESLANLVLLHEKLMAHWKTLFPDNIMILRYEDLVANQEPVTRELLAFCKLDWDPSCLDFNKSVGAVRTSSDSQIRQPLNANSVGKWKRYAQHLKPAAHIMGVEIDDFLT
jgi:tetratricopeptide (TPR) repeat protein